MTAFLPPNLIALFQPREPVEFKAPEGDLPWERDRTKNPYSGIAPFVNDFDPSTETPPKVTPTIFHTFQKKNFRFAWKLGKKKKSGKEKTNLKKG